jgi:hypothetical protein
MNHLKNSVVPVLLALVVAVAVSVTLSVPNVQTVVKEKVVGSVSSPDISSPWFSFGDVRQWASRTTSLIQASTTVCSLQSPASTSTLAFVSIQLDVSTTTASELQFSVGNSPSGTSTLVSPSINKVSANAKATLASSTNVVFSPNQYLTVGMVAVSATQTVSPSGQCQAIWVQN